MTDGLAHVGWPLARLGEALELLARQSGVAPRVTETPAPPMGLAAAGGEALGRWIEAAAAALGLEAEPVEAPYGEIAGLVRGAAPAVLRLPAAGGEPGFLVLAGRGRGGVHLVGPDLMINTVTYEAVRAALCGGTEAPVAAAIDRVLAEAGVPAARVARARAAVLRERLSPVRIEAGWILRLPPDAGAGTQARQAGLPGRLAVFACAHLAYYLTWILSWWMVGRGALGGRLDRGWLLAWALLLLTQVPFRLLVTWSQGLLALGAGALLKLRLLHGALRLDPEEIRREGAGRLLGRVLESEAVESLALSAGFLGLVAGLELVVSAAILCAGAGGWPHAAALAGWTAVALAFGAACLRRRRAWTDARLAMTHDLVERMVGHRTRLAQEARGRWHEGEDQALAGYAEASVALDRSAVALDGLVPRGWLVIGLAALAPAFVAGTVAPAALAVALGGILLAQRALEKLGLGLSHLAGAAIAWDQVAPLFAAAARPGVPGAPAFALPARAGPSAGGTATAAAAGATLIEAHDLVFRYRDRGEPVLRGVSCRVCAGDRLLLEGPSGGGKSTLASLLVGLRIPESGLLLLHGLDRRTLGAEGWRRRVVAAPQFHENHVLTETFAFNLLMGRRWPPLPEDLAEAESLCRELGLGELLQRMPAGLLQMVGETGWQLSHGERSRLYIARALLQGAELVVLDESFAALDPENLQRALRCVLDRAPTLLVIAHP